VAQLKIQSLEERWRRHLIQFYGPKSETLSNLQLELLEEEPSARAMKWKRNRAVSHCRNSRRVNATASGASRCRRICHASCK